MYITCLFSAYCFSRNGFQKKKKITVDSHFFILYNSSIERDILVNENTIHFDLLFILQNHFNLTK